jgi:hypothetical protein
MLTACAGMLAFATAAHATIVGSHVVNGDGTVTYSYTVDNSGGLFDVSAWSLDFLFATPDWDPFDVFSGGGVDVPAADWFASPGTPVTGLSAEDFLSLSPLGDVLIGGMLGGFSFSSSFLPGIVSYHEFSATGESNRGTTIGPTASVPDGGEWLALIAGATLVAFGFAVRSFDSAARVAPRAP